MKQKTFRPSHKNSGKSGPRTGGRGTPRDDTRTAEKPAFKKSFTPRHEGSSSQRLTGPVLYGFHAVRAAMLNPKRRVLRLLATDTAADEFQATRNEAQAAGLKRPNIEIIEKIAFDRMLPMGAVHQGIAVTVESLPVLDAQDIIDTLKPGQKSTLLILDQVTDPHNVGAILRSAAAFGASGVILQDKTAPDMTGVLAKTASGAADVIPVALEVNLSRCIETLQENGFFVIGLDERGEDIGKLPHYDRLALVLGAEGAGLRRLVAEHCDTLASLPTQGAILSLNVSNAAAVALYATRDKI